MNLGEYEDTIIYEPLWLPDSLTTEAPEEVPSEPVSEPVEEPVER